MIHLRAAAIATFAVVSLSISSARIRADVPSSAPTTAPADDALYSDPDAQSSATITQVLPNSSTSQMILTNVKSIHVRQGILVINWGGTATTLLPQQFVTGLTVNKRTAVSAGGHGTTQ